MKELMTKRNESIKVKVQQIDTLQKNISSLQDEKKLLTEKMQTVQDQNKELKEIKDDLENKAKLQTEQLNEALQEKEKSVEIISSKKEKNDQYEKELAVKS